MDDTQIAVTDNPVATDFETVNTYEAPDFTKYRFVSTDITLDVALLRLAADETNSYIEGRMEEMQHMEIDIPKPYKAEIDTRKQDAAHPLTFQKEHGSWYGLGHADPEYRLIVEGMDQIPRYRYFITWKYFPEQKQLAEIEIYAPPQTLDVEELQELVQHIRMN